MSLAVNPKKVDTFMDGTKMAWKLRLWKFTKSGKFHVRYGEKTVAYLDMDFLHDGVPQMKWLPMEFAEMRSDLCKPVNLGNPLPRCFRD